MGATEHCLRVVVEFMSPSMFCSGEDLNGGLMGLNHLVVGVDEPCCILGTRRRVPVYPSLLY